MADDSETPLQDYMREIYGHGRESAGPAGDPNSLGYALQGPAAPWTTADDLRVMAHQQDERAQEGPKSAANIIATLMGLGLTARGAGLNTEAARRANPTTERVGGNWPEAIVKHIQQERKEGNPLLGPVGDCL